MAKKAPSNLICIVCHRPGASWRPLFFREPKPGEINAQVCDECYGDRHMKVEAIKRAQALKDQR